MPDTERTECLAQLPDLLVIFKDCARRDLGTVELGEVRDDLPLGRPPAVSDNSLIDARPATQPRANDLRVECAVAIASV
jgi:hypothetical protein